MVIVRTMTIMRIGVSWGEGWMNGGEVKVAKTIDAGGQELLSPPSFFIHLSQSKYVWGERGSVSGPELCLSWRRIHNGISGSAVYVYCVFTYTVVRVVVHYNESWKIVSCNVFFSVLFSIRWLSLVLLSGNNPRRGTLRRQMHFINCLEFVQAASILEEMMTMLLTMISSDDYFI